MRALPPSLALALSALPACGSYGLTQLDTGGGEDVSGILEVSPTGEISFGSVSPAARAWSMASSM